MIYDELLSNMTFNFTLRLYTKDGPRVPGAVTHINSEVKRAGRDLGREMFIETGRFRYIAR